MKSFITGSRAYGVPSESSDIDLVILASEEDRHILEAFTEGESPIVRFGRLNLIVCRSDDEFAAWKSGTAQLKMKAEKGEKSTRDNAKELIISIQKSMGIGYRDCSGDTEKEGSTHE